MTPTPPPGTLERAGYDAAAWVLAHGQTAGLVALLLLIPFVLLCLVLLFLQVGARWIVIFYVWRRFLDALRGRAPSRSGHPGGAGGHSREYLAFMASPAWERQRRRVLRRDRGRCRECGGRAEQVHHEFYADPIAETPDWGLVSLCKLHHELAHGKGDY